MLFTDLVGSTDLKRRLGDVVAARAMAAHDVLFRNCLKQHNGTEQDDAGDGFFATFAVPSDAVRCGLAFQSGLNKLDLPERLSARVGVHMGEVMQVASTDARDEPPKLLGLAIDTAARVMSLAQGGQVLITRHAFDSVRQQRVTGPNDETVEWLAHGEYQLKGVEEPLEIFEAGVPDFSPLTPPPDSEKAKRVLAPGEEATLGWRPAADLPVPNRETWLLKRKLGAGGFGEVWLAEHKVTRDLRTFKFCFEADRLRSLKRELTLFRLMKEVLGERPDITRLHDVQFDEPPFFLEMDFAAGGDLQDWSEAHGGIQHVELSTRLKLIAQVADALAAAHSVGVIHKDVKPANVLIDEQKDGQLQAKLTDFGIGQIVLDEALKKAGITSTAFDPSRPATMADYGPRTGTQIYMAPELTVDKPPSIQSDVFALGVMLYQMVIGDLSQPIAQGWEQHVNDDLLREDIAACIAGAPEERLPTADTLARRLRSLDKRRAERVAEREQTRRDARRRHLLRLTSVAAAVFVFLSIIAGAGYWQAITAEQRTATERDRAVRAEQQAAEERDRAFAAEAEATRERDRALAAEQHAEHRFKQVHELAKSFIFDFHDSIAHLTGSTPARELIVKKALEYLDSLAAEAQDDANLQLDLALAYLKVGDVQGGRVAGNLGQLQAAIDSYKKSFEICDALQKAAPEDPNALRCLAFNHERLSDAYVALGSITEAREHLSWAQSIMFDLFQSDSTDADLARNLAILHNKMAAIYEIEGYTDEALQALHSALGVLESLSEEDPTNDQWLRDRALVHSRIAVLQVRKLMLDEGEQNARHALALDEVLVEYFPTNGQYRRDLAMARYGLGDVLLLQGKTDEAAALVRMSFETFQDLATADPSNAEGRRDLSIAHGRIAKLAIVREDYDAALDHYEQALEIQRKLRESDPDNGKTLRDVELLHCWIGDVLMTIGYFEDALEHFDEALVLAKDVLRLDFSSADALRDIGLVFMRLAAAHAAVAEDTLDFADLRLERWCAAQRWVFLAEDLFIDMRDEAMLAESQTGIIEELGVHREACAAIIEFLESEAPLLDAIPETGIRPAEEDAG